MCLCVFHFTGSVVDDKCVFTYFTLQVVQSAGVLVDLSVAIVPRQKVERSASPS